MALLGMQLITAASSTTNIVLIGFFTVGLVTVILVPFLADLLNAHKTYRMVITKDPQAAKVLGPPTGIQGAARATMAFAVLTVVGFALGYILVEHPLADNGKVVNTIVVALTTTLASIAAFYFGSKQASDARRAAAAPGQPPSPPPAPPADLSVTITTPADGDTYTLNQAVTADYACTPSAGAGVVTLDGPVPSGSPIDTSKLGSVPFTVSASDSARKTVEVTNTYTVVASVP